MKQKPNVVKRSSIAKTRIFSVEAMDIEFSNGEQRQYERLVGSEHGAVLVVAKPSDHSVLMISEYAAGTDRYELAFPKGKIDPGESMIDAANRELQEETGFGARKLTHVHSMTIAPGYLGHTTHIILAEDLYPSTLGGDEPETLEVSEWTFSQLPELLSRNDFTEARSIAAFYYARDLAAQTEID
ncbi:MAG: ADP compounds hydrolase NudE [Gammaproteobacteria bacterium]|nr:ADP compounds hydrolase NudE [Gammaproteobacteria bacterium]